MPHLIILLLHNRCSLLCVLIAAKDLVSQRYLQLSDLGTGNHSPVFGGHYSGQAKTFAFASYS